MGKVKKSSPGPSNQLKRDNPRYFNTPMKKTPVASGSSVRKGVKATKNTKEKRERLKTLQKGGISPPKPKTLQHDRSEGQKQGSGKDKKHRKQKNGARKGGKRKDKGEDQEASQETRKRITEFKNSKPKTEWPAKLKMIVKLGGKWFEEETAETTPESANANEQNMKPVVNQANLAGVRKSAEKLLENDCQAYRQLCLQSARKSDFQWMDKMMKIGTLPDKMAAYVVKIQDSPVHSLHHLQNLISMVKVQSKQQCLMAAETLKDLFLEDLLPPNRKLVTFDKRANLMKCSSLDLIKHIYEDRLKLSYSSFIQALKRMSLDNVEKIRAKSILIIHELLSAHPEQEAELLQMLVNKLGDPLKKVGSRALFYLSLLLENHPRMKLVVIDEVERLLFRNNVVKRAQYYGICFLNSIKLQNEHPEVGCKLIGVYVAFFKGCIKTGDIDSRMMSGLLTGVNRAYPLAKEYGFDFKEYADTLYKIVHMSNFNIGVQALSILFQLMDIENRPNEADRYYRTLYKELLRPEMSVTSHSLQFLNLIFRSMKCDNNINRVTGFSKRILQLCESVQPNLACALLFMLSEVSKTHIGVIRTGRTIEETVGNQSNLNEAADNVDSEEERDNEEKITSLMRISNVKVSEDASSRLHKNENPRKDFESTSKKNGAQCIMKETTDEGTNISIVDLNTSSILQESADIKLEYKHSINDYDPYARNPSYCGAEFSLSHEVATLIKHYHPSVALFAKTLLQNQQIVYDGNPLKDFTVARFLERFVYKNSKKQKSTPSARSYQPKGLRNLPVNSDDYLREAEDNIPEEEKFFYRYFKERKESKTGPEPDESDAESVDDEEFDELMANYFKSAKGKDLDDDDEDDFEVDFAANIQKGGGKTKKKNEQNNSDSEGSDVDDQEESDEDMDGPHEDADEMIDFDDEDDIDFQDEDGLEVFEEDTPPKRPKFSKKGKGKDVDMFAPAEQFAEMLEANVEESLAGPNVLINRDNADPKQIKWEMDRDRWVKGYTRNKKTTFKKAANRKKFRSNK